MIDSEIARRLRLLRTEHGISQTELAEKLGLSSQQIQKYEGGVDRISASRLKELSDIFYVSLDYFFGGPKEVGNLKLVPAGHASRLMLAFSKVKHSQHRRAIVRLVEDLAKDN